MHCQFRATFTKKPCDYYIQGGFCTRSDMFRCLEYVARNTITLSYSSVRDYTRCKRRFLYSWMYGLQPVELPESLRMGSLVSKILGILHDSRLNTDEAEARYKDIINTSIQESIDPEDEHSEGDYKLWGIKGFFDAYISKERHHVRGIPEYEFMWKIIDYPNLHGYIDLYMEHLNTAYEFKWTTNQHWYDKFHASEQSSAYFLGVSELQNITWVLMSPPKLKPKAKEAMLTYCERVYNDVLKYIETQYIIKKVYWRTEFDLVSYAGKLKMISQEISRMMQMQNVVLEHAFYQNDNGCYTPSECEYVPICSSGVIPENLYVKKSAQRSIGGQHESIVHA